ncbi:PRC-barrel domain-containing protein [Egicoccus sp. AB-alg2]|uniref:PRC-barrel domain-containing protein n=1 Tax=Egicoccus sp. AB-alg2 TaxID=3242693 RepID=UPI00359DE1A8
MYGKQDLYELIGATAYDRDGQKLGTVDTVFVDTETGEPTFAAVTTGLFGTRSSFVPLVDANFRDGDLHVAHAKDRVHDAPNIDVDEHLAAADERELYRYYGIPLADDVTSAHSDAADDGDASRATDAEGTGAPAGGHLPSGADLIADQGIDPMLDGPMVAPDERLRLRRLGAPVGHAEEPRMYDDPDASQGSTDATTTTRHPDRGTVADR